MAILLALAAAGAYGTADFLGGLVSRRSSALTTALLSQLAGCGPLLAVVLASSGFDPSTMTLVAGVAAGLAEATGIVLLYRALAIGRMSIVAPITGVAAAGIPVLSGLVIGEHPSTTSLLGAVVALAAIALLGTSAGSPEGDSGRADSRVGRRGIESGVLEALAAGFSFGAFFTLLHLSGEETGMSPLLVARIVAVLLLTAVALIAKRPLHPERSTTFGIVMAGTLEAGGNLLFLLATRRGLLSLVAVLTSMYPVVTVLLARISLGERLHRLQGLGLACAAAGIALIVGG